MNRLFIVILVTLLISAAAYAEFLLHPPEYQGLPHRQPWEFYRQGNSPAEHECPDGTFAFYVIESDKPFFIECLRSNTNAQ